MLILGIETSCDETAAALVQDGTKIISSVKATSFISKKFGGVVPDKTAREQLKFILPVIHKCFLAANPSPLSPSDVDAIAVTIGPGLIGSLLVGVETAKTLAFAWSKPLVPVNHLIGHIYANWLQQDDKTARNSEKSNAPPVHSLPFDRHPAPDFPALILLVSGGHSEIILMSGHGNHKLLGSTRDDAAGECFDKCGRLLNLPYPYGPFIEKLAQKHDPDKSKTKITLPRPMASSKNLDLSFSGLKTAFANELKRGSFPKKEDFFANALAHELQEAVTDVLVSKTLKAAKKYQPKSILLCGGVAANLRLREKLTTNCSPLAPIYIPPIDLCTDNAAYIASAAYFNYKPISWEKINADPDLDF